MFISLLAVIGGITVAKWLLPLVFPETAFRLRAYVVGRALLRALKKHAQQFDQR